MSGKRYFWLKLKDDFFTSKRIKKLRKLAGGDTYTIIYLKMQLKALKTDGVLKWSGLEDNFADELALDLDESPDNVRITLQYLLSCGLIETSDDISFFLPYAIENTGSETASTQRWRDWKARQVLDSNTKPTLDQHFANAEIEKDIDIEIEKEKDDGFEAFWTAYPRKSGDIKQACFEYLGVIQSGVDPQTILDAVKWQAEAKGQYMPNAEKWLRNKGWTEKRPDSEKSTKRGYTSAADYTPPPPPTMEELDALLEKI